MPTSHKFEAAATCATLKVSEVGVPPWLVVPETVITAVRALPVFAATFAVTAPVELLIATLDNILPGFVVAEALKEEVPYPLCEKLKSDPDNSLGALLLIEVDPAETLEISAKLPVLYSGGTNSATEIELEAPASAVLLA